MKYSLLISILIFSLLVPAPNLTQAQSPELAEAEQLSLQVVELYKKGKHDEALPLAQRALTLREKALPSNHISIARALVNLAEIYLAKAKRKEAKPYYQRAIAIYDKNSGVDNTGFVKILDRYVCILSDLGQHDEVLDARKRLFKLDNGFEYDESLHHPISLPRPTYPVAARSKRIAGTVVAKVTVDETGTVIDAKILCGHPLLVEGAGPAIWKARFQPPMNSGHPVKMIDIVTYNFVNSGNY